MGSAVLPAKISGSKSTNTGVRPSHLGSGERSDLFEIFSENAVRPRAEPPSLIDVYTVRIGGLAVVMDEVHTHIGGHDRAFLGYPPS
jgi:hypothetical protein